MCPSDGGSESSPSPPFWYRALKGLWNPESLEHIAWTYDILKLADSAALEVYDAAWERKLRGS